MNTTVLQQEKSIQIRKRHAELFGMGMAKHSYGFAFRGYYVPNWCIEDYTPEQWEKYIVDIRKKNEELKAEADLSEKESAKAFVRYVGDIQAPVFKDERLNTLFEETMVALKAWAIMTEEEVENVGS